MIKSSLPFFVFWVGTRCTLRCRDCTNLIPFSDQISYSMDRILDDLRKFLDCCDIRDIQIQGGEPFTHPDLINVIKLLNEYSFKNIEIATNGTIIPNQQFIETFKLLKKPNLFIRISPYESVKSKQKQFADYMIENGISIRYHCYCPYAGKWTIQGGPNQPRNNNDMEVQKMYSKCAYTNCITLADGKIYRCGRGPLSEKTFNLTFTDHDAFDVRGRSPEACAKDFISWYNSPIFKEHCRHCLATQIAVEPAIQL